MSLDIFMKYEVVRRLNTGGMGEILLARQKGVDGSQRTVIIKMMLPHLAADPEFVSRFTDESRLAASLSHGNIVRVFESGCWEGRLYMVMEHVDGMDLREILRKIPPEDTVEHWIPLYIHVLSETAKALTYAYNKKDDGGRPLMIVHRDVSPSNILVSGEGLVKLTDFGVAKAARRTSVTMPGRLHGKVSYMAPEQVRGMDCDHRSDVFSLGVVGYEMLARRRPFDGDSDVAVLEKIRSMSLAPLSEAAPSLDPDLAGIIMKALESNPDARWQTAEEFSAALLAWAHSRGINMMSSVIAGLLRDSLEPERTPDETPGASLDNIVENGLEQMLGRQALPNERTGTISGPVNTGSSSPGAPTGETAPVWKRPGRRWAAVTGGALFLAGITLLVSHLLLRPPGPGSAGPSPVDPPDQLTQAAPVVVQPDATVRSDAHVMPDAEPPAIGRDSTVTGQSADRRTASDENKMVSRPRAPAPRALPTPDPDAVPGRLRFRFFPADSMVFVDGRQIAVKGNLVEIDLPAGSHDLAVRSNKGDLVETRSFNIEPGLPLALGTIELGVAPAP